MHLGEELANMLLLACLPGGRGTSEESTVLTVTAAVLQSIAVTPANPTVGKGLTQQFTATGTYSDNSTPNLTAQVTWASATPSVAIGATGLATPVNTGTSTISASLGAVSGSTVLTVTAAVQQSIAVTPANPTVGKGLTQQFTATGTYSDTTAAARRSPRPTLYSAEPRSSQWPSMVNL
jgi:Bacterial Ig-like domain (group 2)